MVKSRIGKIDITGMKISIKSCVAKISGRTHAVTKFKRQITMKMREDNKAFNTVCVCVCVCVCVFKIHKTFS